MFGRGNLMRDGIAVQGRITESGAAMAFVTGDSQGYHVKVRVEFDDGTTAEISRKVHRHLGVYDVGATLPLRYDKDDRSKIEIDEPAMKAAADETRATVRQLAAEKAAKPVNPDATPGISSAKATAIAMEQLSQLEGRHNRGEVTDEEYAAQQEAIRAEARKYL